MPDDENTTQNPTPEENPSPASPQEPTLDAPILPMDSATTEAPSEAPEASRDGFSAKSDNTPPSNSTSTDVRYPFLKTKVYPPRREKSSITSQG